MKEISLPHLSWYSLQLLLDYYSPAVLMTVIEKSGVFVIDSVGRFVYAIDEVSDSRYSRQYAVRLLEAHYAELENPGPDYSWQDERWESEPHPTYFFGWPREYLPSIKIKEPVVVQRNSNTMTSWSERTPEEFVTEKNLAGSFAKAAEIHGVTRQRYTEVYNKVVHGRK